MRVPPFRAIKLRMTPNGCGAVGFTKIGPSAVAVNKYGLRQSGITEDGIRKLDLLKNRPTQVGAAEVRSAHIEDLFVCRRTEMPIFQPRAG